MRPDRDRVALLLVAAPAAVFCGIFLMGRTFFWGDLIYIHQAWRALAAEMVQEGRLPLWDPYLYLGMPLAANMQNGVWYPGSIMFHLFPLSLGLALFHAVHYGLIAFFAFLWLRREGFDRAASSAGAMVFAFCGFMAGRIPFLDHLSSLAFLPAFLLFRGNAGLLSLAFSLSFLSGYAPMLAGGASAALVLPLLWAAEPLKEARTCGSWALAGLLAAGLASLLLLPAAQLAAGSQRGGGLGTAETLMFAMAPRDLWQWLSPLFAPAGGFSPSVFWWKTCYLGLAAWLALFLALPRLRPRAAAGLGLYLAGVLLLCLGGSNPVSDWVWFHFAPLRYVRYPGNMAYLAMPAVSLLVAAGLHRRPRGRLIAAAIALELSAYASVAQPTVPRGCFTDEGPLVGVLRPFLGNHRYLLSPLALEWQRGYGPDAQAQVLDLKHRLYGETNAPYHLASVGNFGEPLVPRVCYDAMDFLYRRRSLAEAAAWLPWLDAAVLMTKDKLAPGPLLYAGKVLWHLYRAAAEPSRALWFDAEAGARLPAVLPEASAPPSSADGRKVRFDKTREDRFQASGTQASPGWVYVAEPRVAGWKAWLDGRRVETEPAFGAFLKVRVPAGRWELRFLYDPPAWKAGLAVSLLFICAMAAYWYNRLL